MLCNYEIIGISAKCGGRAKISSSFCPILDLSIT
jgi:hypothetical protein